MWAAVKGHTAFVKMLLAAGANAELTDKASQAAELLAGKHNQQGVAKILCDNRAAAATAAGDTTEINCNIR